MTDIKIRLRYDTGHLTHVELIQLCAEAAAEIDQLRAVIKMLELELAEHRGAVEEPMP
jgi:hypothetical protein